MAWATTRSPAIKEQRPLAQAGALSNKLSENGSWNFVLTNTGLQATHVDDGLGTNGGAGAVLSNTLHGVFTDAMLNGGLNATLIDASAFSATPCW